MFLACMSCPSGVGGDGLNGYDAFASTCLDAPKKGIPLQASLKAGFPMSLKLACLRV